MALRALCETVGIPVQVPDTVSTHLMDATEGGIVDGRCAGEHWVHLIEVRGDGVGAPERVSPVDTHVRHRSNQVTLGGGSRAIGGR